MNKNPLAKEHISANEEQISNKIIKILARSLTKNYVGGDGQRRFHAKSHGLLKAGLTVNALLAAEYRTAIFEPGKMYDVWVRFSNGFPEKTPDTKKGIRGMAIKILNVNGPCLEKDDMGFTQDILLTNVPILFPGKARLQPALIKLLFGTISQKIGGAFGILLSFRLGRLFKFINGGIQPASFLDIHYSSATAYLYGADKAIKWHAIPKSPAAGKFDKNDDADYLRKRLAADLSANEYEFGLHIQLQRDAITDPIEDASIEWTGPTIEIGTIKIDKQQFDFEERRLLEKQILFSPWYSVEDHRPLGSINRIRRTIYKAMSKLRKEQNDMG
ncbi:MAG: hypothetical protein ABI091_09700 [Ferruginibacter sp.]